MSSMTPESSEELRRLEEQEETDHRHLLDFCLTEDEYLDTWRGDPPLSVIRRRDRYYGRNQ